MALVRARIGVFEPFLHSRRRPVPHQGSAPLRHGPVARGVGDLGVSVNRRPARDEIHIAVTDGRRATMRRTILVAAVVVLAPVGMIGAPPASSQETGPEMLHPRLAVRTVVTGLVTPTTLAFIGSDDLLVLEKNTGRVMRVTEGTIQGPVLDLAVNFASERGLLGIALHPDFPANPGVYLYWTESTTGADTAVLSEVPLLGNRVDRFVWDGTSLAHDADVIRIRAWQPIGPGEVREFGNHDGGVIAFGPDDKLYVFIGDVGRRGQMQNLASGP